MKEALQCKSFFRTRVKPDSVSAFSFYKCRRAFEQETIWIRAWAFLEWCKIYPLIHSLVTWGKGRRSGQWYEMLIGASSTVPYPHPKARASSSYITLDDIISYKYQASINQAQVCFPAETRAKKKKEKKVVQCNTACHTQHLTGLPMSSTSS